MKITVFYVGASLLSPLRRAEDDINARYKLGLQVAAYNCGAPLNEVEWRAAESDLIASDLVLVIHVTDGENASRIALSLEAHRDRQRAVIAFNCMPDLMRCTRMGKLDFSTLMKPPGSPDQAEETSAPGIARKLGMWMSEFVRGRTSSSSRQSVGPPAKADHYVKLIGRLPAILKFLPAAGKLADIKH